MHSIDKLWGFEDWAIVYLRHAYDFRDGFVTKEKIKNSLVKDMIKTKILEIIKNKKKSSKNLQDLLKKDTCYRRSRILAQSAQFYFLIDLNLNSKSVKICKNNFIHFYNLKILIFYKLANKLTKYCYFDSNVFLAIF